MIIKEIMKFTWIEKKTSALIIIIYVYICM